MFFGRRRFEELQSCLWLISVYQKPRFEKPELVVQDGIRRSVSKTSLDGVRYLCPFMTVGFSKSISINTRPIFLT